MKITTKANGKLLKPWKIAETVFHAEETVRAEHLELVQKAHLVPEPERKKHDGKDIFQPGEVFFITKETSKGPMSRSRPLESHSRLWRTLSLPQSRQYLRGASDFCNCS